MKEEPRRAASKEPLQFERLSRRSSAHGQMRRSPKAPFPIVPSQWWYRCLPEARPIFCVASRPTRQAVCSANRSSSKIVREARAEGCGTESVLRSAPDGYTILCAPQLTYSITHLIFSKAAFDTRAMEPVSVLATYPLIVLARSGLPANNMAELIASARANPGKVNYGHQGKGNTGHLLGELMMLKGDFQMTGIPYRGSAPAINDLLAGNIDIVPDYLLANKQNVDAGKLKMLPRCDASG